MNYRTLDIQSSSAICFLKFEPSARHFDTDQMPTNLAPDTLKSANLKSVYRIIVLEDRETIGGAINMSPEQIEYLSSLIHSYFRYDNI